MLIVRTIEDSTDSVGEVVGSEQPVGLNHLAFTVYPLGLYGVQPRTLLRKKATDDPHAFAAFFNFSVVFAEPPPHLFGNVPACVVPDEQQNLLADRFELFTAPLKKLSRYGTYGSSVHKPQPRLVEFWQIESLAGDGLWLGVVFGNRSLEEALGLAFLGPATQSG